MDGEVRSLRSRNSKLVIALNEKDEEIAQWKRSISSLKALSADRDNEVCLLTSLRYILLCLIRFHSILHL